MSANAAQLPHSLDTPGRPGVILRWVHTPGFDLTLIFGVAGLALLAGLAVSLDYSLFTPLLFIDLWFLGYHHVIATFTRIAFDANDRKEHTFLLMVLPWVVLAATIGLATLDGLRGLATVYLYWQWFHYTRQSYGVLRLFERKHEITSVSQKRLNTLMLYNVPLVGILWLSYQHPGTFLSCPVHAIPVPSSLMWAAVVVSLVTDLVWIVSQLYAWHYRRLAVTPLLFLLSHSVIFYVSYVGFSTLDFGWLVLNVWHNAQYILIVWLFNNRRFNRNDGTQTGLLPTISRSGVGGILTYFGTCLAISTVLYLTIALALHREPLASIPLAAMVVYQTLNFHHYIVDSKIWKIRRPNIQKTFGVAASAATGSP